MMKGADEQGQKAIGCVCYSLLPKMLLTSPDGATERTGVMLATLWQPVLLDAACSSFFLTIPCSLFPPLIPLAPLLMIIF